MFSCVIIDDEPLAVSLIEEYINRAPDLKLMQKFTNPVKAFEFLFNENIDILFIDIEMPDLSGLELVKKLKSKPAVIFTTAYDKYAFQGFKVDAIDYLLKPIDYPDFLKAIEKAKRTISINKQEPLFQIEKNFLFVKSEHKIKRLELESIIYIEGMSEYVRFFIENAKPVLSLISLKALVDKLPINLFMRVHKSYIINLTKISEIENNIVVCKGGKTIPVSQLYKSQFQQYLNANNL